MADQPRPKKKLKLGLSKKKKKKKLEALNIGEAAPAAPVIAHRAGSLKKPSTTVPPTAHQQIHQQQNAMAIKGKMEPLPMPRNYSSSSPPLSSPTTIMPVPALATALIFTANAMHSNSRRHEEKSIQSFLPTVQSLELTPSSTIHSAWAPARKNAFW
eukprot:gene1641-30176_t